jgi:hypothetical protein
MSDQPKPGADNSKVPSTPPPSNPPPKAPAPVDPKLDATPRRVTAGYKPPVSRVARNRKS